MYCDLHMHSTASDGTDVPGALAGLAHEAGLSAIALTDHDTTAGLEECARACEEMGIDFVPGIELSIDPGVPVGTFHLLGYFVHDECEALNEIIDTLQASRASRTPRIVERLNEVGVEITEAEIERVAGGGTVGRPHIAGVLIEKGYVETIKEAFEKYLGVRGAAHMRRDKIQPVDAIAAIHGAGGLAVLAHPVQLRMEDDVALEKKLGELAEMGLDGIEVLHPDHVGGDAVRFGHYAAKLGLMRTGGSDYHGTRKAIEMGCQAVPVAFYERLEAARG